MRVQRGSAGEGFRRPPHDDGVLAVVGVTHAGIVDVEPYSALWLEFWADLGRPPGCVERTETHRDAPRSHDLCPTGVSNAPISPEEGQCK